MTYSQPAPKPDLQSGIDGSIMMSPAHGGPTVQGEDDSAPLRDTVFIVSLDDKIVGSFVTDDGGHFRTLLLPGRYSVAAKGRKAGINACGPFPVEVVSGQMQHVQWQCDSGLR
jgi:hypothetical protein